MRSAKVKFSKAVNLSTIINLTYLLEERGVGDGKIRTGKQIEEPSPVVESTMCIGVPERVELLIANYSFDSINYL